MTATTQNLVPAASPSRITIDDVRSAIGDADPNSTNASKVRALLGGRGSFETIQKHLGTLRAEAAAAAAPPVATDLMPALPAEAAQVMWVAAWAAAQVQTMARSEKLAAERDAAFLKLDTMSLDVGALVATVDEQAAELERAAAAVAAVQGAHIADVERHLADKAAAADAAAELAEQQEGTVRELAKVQASAAHAAELAEARQEGMRGELARLTDQVGELKAALYKRADHIQIPIASE